MLIAIGHRTGKREFVPICDLVAFQQIDFRLIRPCLTGSRKIDSNLNVLFTCPWAKINPCLTIRAVIKQFLNKRLGEHIRIATATNWIVFNWCCRRRTTGCICTTTSLPNPTGRTINHIIGCNHSPNTVVTRHRHAKRICGVICNPTRK